MKYLYVIIIGNLLLWGCKKEKYGNTRQAIRVTTESYSGKRALNDYKYTQFGDFITAITPSSFIGELMAVRFHDDTIYGNLGGSFMIMVMIDLHAGEEPIIADFSNGTTLSVIPELNGDMMNNPDGQGASYKNDVTFKFLWIGMGLNQVIELPEEYTNVNLNQFSSSQKVGNRLTTGMQPLNAVVNEISGFGNGISIYFEMTDSTYVAEGTILGNSWGRYIRSSLFEEWTMTPPLPDETKTYVSTIGFPNEDIIQIYAGADNIPYNSDDIIVLEPKFWERIYVNVSEN